MYESEKMESEPLTTKNAVKFLLDGTLRLRVCRYCLKICSNLTELEEILEIGIDGGLHEVTIKDMVASFHPFQVEDNTSYPNKICQDCLNCAMKAYLFTQQCERAERAIRNCFDDINDKFEKLDPVEPVKKRGKRKLHPNSNILYVENQNVMDYAHPVINIINTKSVITDDVQINALECLKCWQILPSPESLVNHEEAHPKSMWYNCKQCGKSFVKRFHLRQHIKKAHNFEQTKEEIFGFQCKECGSYSKSLGEHFQHMEKHKFKTMLRHIMERKVDRLCVLCLENGTRMTDFSEILYLCGGYPGLDGEYSVKAILTSVFSNVPFIDIGTRVCETCLKHSINSYIFTSKIDHVNNRFNTCVTQLIYNLDSLKGIKKTVMIEISNNVVLPMINYGDYDYNGDENQPSMEVLEDEFREEIKSDTSESEEENPAKNVTKTYSRPLVNGYKNSVKINNVCDEFLTFTKKEMKREFKRPRKILFTCPLCNKLFISDYFMKKHLLKHVYRTSKCSKCSMQFISKFHLFEHTKMVHILKKKSYYSCNVCKRTFTSVNKLKLHYKTHRVKECHLCNKVFKNQKTYDVHIQRHMVKVRLFSNDNKQTCSFCEKSCTNENELSLHVNKVHLQMKPYNCDMCEKSYYTEYNLNSHKQLHSLFSIEQCTFCSRTFKCRRNLVVHVRKHIGIKPHQCPACRQAFYSDNLMKKHMKVFHGGRYWCRLCKAVLKTSIDLKAHISVAHSAM